MSFDTEMTLKALKGNARVNMISIDLW